MDLQTIKNIDIPLMSLIGITTIGKVVEMYDGDTCKIVLMNNNKLEKYNCRLLGLDTPEMKPPLTKENRDIEILSVGSVLFRPKLKQKFYNPLIDGVHYIGFDEDENPKNQIEIIKEKFTEIRNQPDLLKSISENGLKWYHENGSINGNVNVLKEVVKIEKLK